MSDDPIGERIPGDDAVARELVLVVRVGDVAAVRRLLAEHPRLPAWRLVGRGGGTRTPLHLVADWPGYFPNGPELVALLIDAGADPNAGTTGRGSETPLHWAASSDDVDVAAALIDGGADVEAPGGSIAGTPLANAVGYGCWNVARLLVARGARIERLWQAAALGARERVDELLNGQPPPTPAELDEAFWQACHGGRRRMAEYLLDRGANPNAKPAYANQTAVEIAGAADTQRQALVDWLRDRGAARG